MSRRPLTVLTAVFTIALIAIAAAPASAHEATHPPRALRIAAYDFGYRGVPARLDEGTYQYSFANTSRDEDHEIAFFKLYNPRTTARQVQDEIRNIIDTTPPGESPDPTRITLFDLNTYQGTQAAAGQRSDNNTATFTDGAYVYLCMVPSPDHALEPHVLLGMIGKLRIR